MRLSPNDPLVARASSAAMKPKPLCGAPTNDTTGYRGRPCERPATTNGRCYHHAGTPDPAELELEAWDAPAIAAPEQPSAQLGPTWLVLPYPPGVNSLYGHRVMQVRGRAMAVPYKTHEHRKYFEQLGAHVGHQVVPWPKDVDLVVTLKLFRPRRIGDIDGPVKTLFDALNGRAWADDSQVVDLHLIRRDDKANPRVEVSIQPAAPTTE